ncbi:MAG: Cys-tRNA(Pro) deacylase [Flavobacteriia bacterium]|nr:Cys-tRNA(Pro) deacylase [Flavobacteriia bacterium]OJX37545.1 MAG: aminoacyl-tRNA deacylase [Flavobacteriia bacterium 40-80]
MLAKTNAVRILDTMKISYTLREYEVSENDVSAEYVAEKIGVEPEKLYKTLVLKGNAVPFIVAVIPSSAQLDLKKIAKVSGNKHCEMLLMKDLLSVTGYIRGGCSPIGMKKQFPTYIEELAQTEEQIIISAGKRGLQLVIAPEDLQKAVQAEFADLI